MLSNSQRAIELEQFINQAENKELQFLLSKTKSNNTKNLQLADTFHLWSAHNAGITQFVTCDYKFINVARNNKYLNSLSCEVLRPTEFAKSHCHFDPDYCWDQDMRNYFSQQRLYEAGQLIFPSKPYSWVKLLLPNSYRFIPPKEKCFIPSKREKLIAILEYYSQQHTVPKAN